MGAFFRTEWGKLRVMSFRDKRQYIWEYYKVHIFIFAIVGFIIGSLINVWFINPPKRDYLYIAWLDLQFVSSAQLERLGHNLDIIVTDPDRYQVLATSYAMTDNPELNMALQSRFTALLSTGSIDVFLTPQEGVQELAVHGMIRPISFVMEEVYKINPELYAYLTDRLLILTFTSEGAEAYMTEPMAISMADSPLFPYLEIDASDLYFAMVINSNKAYELAKSLEAIFGMRTEVPYYG